MNYLDTNVITLAFIRNDKKEECRSIVENGGVVSSLVLVETFNTIERITKNRGYATEVIKTLLRSLEVVNLDHNILFESMKRTNRYNLKIFDLIHYTTALLKECNCIVSYDKHFNDLEIKRVEP